MKSLTVSFSTDSEFIKKTLKQHIVWRYTREKDNYKSDCSNSHVHNNFVRGGDAEDDTVDEENEWIWPDNPNQHLTESAADDETEDAEIAKAVTQNATIDSASATQDQQITDLRSALNLIDAQTENKFDYLNLFDKNIAKNQNLFYDDSTHKFVSDNDRSAVIVNVLPNTTYTISWNKLTGNSRFQVVTSVDMPAPGVEYGTIYTLDQIPGTMRYYKTITTGANDHWLFLYLYYNPELFMSIHQRTKRCLNY